MLFSLLLISILYAFVQSDSIKCTLHIEGKNDRISCMNSLFSTQNDFPIAQSTLHISWDDLCTTSPFSSKKAIVIANRGKCTFETKARMAEQQGYSGLIIVNFNNTIFPMGSSDTSYRSSIPVVMVANSFLPTIRYSTIREKVTDPTTTKTEIPNAHFSLVKEVNTMSASNAVNSNKSNNQEIILLIQWILFSLTVCGTCVIMFYTILFVVRTTSTTPIISYDEMNANKCNNPHNTWSVWVGKWCFRIITIICILCIFLLFRLGTFRKLSLIKQADQDENYFQDYHHRETDEMIFEHLVRAVSHQLMEYQLSPEFIAKYRLAEDNYAFPLFHHPPAFVYFTAFCYHLLSLSLPAVSLLLHMIVILALFGISYEYHHLVLSSLHDVFYCHDAWWKVGIIASLLWCISPIACWCSQKIWIDNMAVMTCSLGVWLHLYCLRQVNINQPLSKRFSTTFFLSGLLGFGGIVLNSKITSFALLPFYVFTILWKHYECEYFHELIGIKKCKVDNNSISLLKVASKAIFPVVISEISFLLGTCFGQLPWLYWYHSQTGRWIPSAWPSQAMLERFPYVKAAVNKPYFTYFKTIAEIAPLEGIGFLVSTVLLCSLLWMVYSFFNNDTKKKLVENDNSSDAPRTNKLIWLALLALWPLSFLFGLTLLGWLGSGFQTRFLLPAIPGSIFVVAVFIEHLLTFRDDNHMIIGSIAELCGVICFIAMVYQVFMCVYYGIFYATLHADLSTTCFDILESILTSPYVAPSSRESFREIQSFMKHFGLVFK